MRTRIAPTPSGYLHTGNAVNFALVDAFAKTRGCEIALRIDDLDAPRVRPEFVEDIFRVLMWLDIEWQVGPRAAADLESWGQKRHMRDYVQARDVLLAQGDAFYACACSRGNRRSSRCVCASQTLTLETDQTSLRMRWKSGEDPVVWRRDGLPAFHLTSVVDDDRMGVTHVVRGEDLQESTEFQQALSLRLPGNRFSSTHALHHPLVLDASGRKLSKSAGAGSRPMVLNSELRKEIHGIVDSFEIHLGQINP